MTPWISVPISFALLLCGGDRVRSQNQTQTDTKEKNIQAILEIFRLIQNRDPQKPNLSRELELVDPNVEMHWPASLPYGGTTRGLLPRPGHQSWGATWTPLQPTSAERKMEPRVVAANENEVVVLYRQRGLSPAGDRYDGEVLGLYEIHSGKLTRAQMFYFDEAGAAAFLAKARGQVSVSKPGLAYSLFRRLIPTSQCVR